MNSPSSSELSTDLDLSSVGSLSPPPWYPSPPPSQEHVPAQDAQNQLKRPREEEDDDAPAAKKRRTVEPKPRTTQYLNLRSSLNTSTTDQKKQMDLLLRVLRKRRKIVVIAGAGISVSAGIPDFRSSTGLFAKLRAEHKLKASGKQLFDASVYQTDASTSSFHDMLRELSEQTAAAEPTEFHHLLAKLASDGRLMRLYTQNVDGLDTSLPPLETAFPLSSKGPWPRTVQLHGGLQKMSCSKCNHISDFEPDLFRGATPPLCTVCIEADKVRTDHAGKRSHGVGKLRPRMLLYNESSPDEDAIGSVSEADLRARPDAVIVVGTTMKVKGLRRLVREMCGVVRGRKDGIAVWLNHEPPPLSKEFEDCWDLVIDGSSDTVAHLANLRHWDDNSVDYKECSESDTERAIANGSDVKVVIDPVTQKMKPRFTKVNVIVESPAKKAVASALLTPAASPRSKSIDPLIPPRIMFPHLKDFGKKQTGVSDKVSKPKQPRKPSAKAAGSKAKTSKSASSVAKTFNARINTAFKVTKPQHASKTSIVLPKIKTSKPIISTGSVTHQLSRPMAPLSPVAARNNGPLLPQKAHIPPSRISSDSPHQENSPVQSNKDQADILEDSPPRTPIRTVKTPPTSPKTPTTPHWLSAHNSPSGPSYEKLVLVKKYMVQNSPSRPFFEKLVYPGDPDHPFRSTFPHTVIAGFAQNAEQAVYGPDRMISESRSQMEKQARSPVSTTQVLGTAMRPGNLTFGGRLKRMSQEIVSPTTIPDSMKELLH